MLFEHWCILELKMLLNQVLSRTSHFMLLIFCKLEETRNKVLKPSDRVFDCQASVVDGYGMQTHCRTSPVDGCDNLHHFAVRDVFENGWI
jgi:hypothetical protein